MSNAKRIVLFSVVLAGLGGVLAATLGDEEAGAMICCSVCDDQWVACLATCDGNTLCEARCDRTLERCAMPMCNSDC